MMTVIDIQRQADLARDFLKSKKNIEISIRDSLELIAAVNGFDDLHNFIDFFSLQLDI